MTRIAYFDAFSGISGDMTVGALIDAGAPAAGVIDSLNALATEARYEVEKTVRGGIAASKFRVHASATRATHRHLNHIVEMIDRSAIAPRAKANATAVFTKLGEAEAASETTVCRSRRLRERPASIVPRAALTLP